jgi:hypothetical protein
MTIVDIFSEEWSRAAIDQEMKLGGIRVGPIKPLGSPTVDDQPGDEATLQQEEEKLRRKLTHLLARMKEREANGREYLRKHGIVPELDVSESSRVFAVR